MVEDFSSDVSNESDTVTKPARYVAESELEDFDSSDEMQSDSEDENAAVDRLSRIPLALQARAGARLQTTTSQAVNRPPSETSESLRGSQSVSDRRGRVTPRHSTHGEAPLPQSDRKRKRETGEMERVVRPSRKSKDAPQEVSSKRPFRESRKSLPSLPSTSKARDPRFDPLSGKADLQRFRQSYSFLGKQREEELQNLKKAVEKSRRNTSLPLAERDKLEKEYNRLLSRHDQEKKAELEESAVANWRKAERKQQEEGKGEFHLKRAEKKKLALEARFENLAGDKRKLNKSIEKKRRKIAQKEKRNMPRTRTVE